MADLRTRYLGLELQSPLVASSSPLTGSLDGLRRLEVAGAGAVVLPSLFEEELAEEAPRPGAGHGDQAGYGAGPAAYLSLLEQAKASLSIPVIASLNGTTRGGWVRHAARLEEAGADALELNIYYVSSRPGLSGGEVEGNYLDVVREVRRAHRDPAGGQAQPLFQLAGQPGRAAGRGRRQRAGAVQPLLPARPGHRGHGGAAGAGAFAARPSCACRCAGSPSCTAAGGYRWPPRPACTPPRMWSRCCWPGRMWP